MPVDSHHDIKPAAGMGSPEPVETHHDIVPAMGVTAHYEDDEDMHPTGYWTDNPGGNWLKGKQEDAYRGRSPTASKGLLGTPTAFAGMDEDKPLFLPVSELSKLRGVNDERRAKGDMQYDDLSEAVAKHGYTNESPVMVFVNHKGQAFLNEGNTRVAVARDNGVKSVKAWVHWYNGAENAPGSWSPKAVAKMERSSRPERAYGGAITPIEIGNRDIDNEARRLILWSYATAPMFGRAAGGRTYPVAMTKEAEGLGKKHAKLKKMSPQEFLNETDPLHIGKGDRKVIDTFKHNIRGGHHLGPLKIYNNGGQDGRHRANAAKELGIKSVPVIDYRKADGGPVVDQAFQVLSKLPR